MYKSKSMPPIQLQPIQVVYDEIAQDFNKTRRALWPGVTKFLDSVPSNSTLLDLGCGNGKYLSYRANDCIVHACDTCASLVHIAREKHPQANIIHADGTSLPYKDNSFDAVMSIAVLHHLPLQAQRTQFINEMIRVVRPGGQLLVTVWATEALKSTWIPLGNNDYIVPWSYSKSGNGQGESHDRFYHLFTKEESQSIFPPQSTNTQSIEWECNNWYTTATKK